MKVLQTDGFIVFSDVAKTFQSGSQSYTAIRDVTLSVRRGDVTMLLGPSGCGKSTLLNLTAGLIGPSQGGVTYDGAPIGGLNHRVAYDAAGSPAAMEDGLRQRFDPAGGRRTCERRSRSPSGGTSLPRGARRLRRILSQPDFGRNAQALRACATTRGQPETLLLDEPFGALDAQLRLTLQAELLRICRKLNLTVMFVTHDIEEAAALGDKCAVFQGRPGTIAKIFDNPLPKDRDLARLRFDPGHHDFTNGLWAMLTPDLATTPSQSAIAASA